MKNGQSMIYWICFLIMKLISLLFLRVTYIGRENLPLNEGFILASNHQSNVDPFVLGVCRWREFCFFAKESLFKGKFSSFMLPRMGAFPVKRDSADIRALKEAIRRLKLGIPLIFFPEGTRGVSDRKKKVNPGVGMIAIKAQVSVVPVYIEGSDKACPDGAKWFTLHPIKIKFGKPLHFTKDQEYPAIAQEILKEIYLLK